MKWTNLQIQHIKKKKLGTTIRQLLYFRPMLSKLYAQQLLTITVVPFYKGEN